MSQSLRQIKSRIRGIENTKKLTKAMEMVSVAKLKRSDKLLGNSNIYFSKIEQLLKNVLPGSDEVNNPLLLESPNKNKIVLCLVTSDTGLCSTYNNNVIRKAENFLSGYDKENVSLVVIGKKGFSYFKRKGFKIEHSFLGLNGKYSDELSDKVLEILSKMFLSGQAGEVFLLYTKIESASRYELICDKFLNISYPKENTREYIFEPSRDKVLKELLPMYISNKLKIMFLNAFTSEHQARAVSMGAATTNAVDLLETMILLRNKVRQANITREMLEVISSAEALKG